MANQYYIKEEKISKEEENYRAALELISSVECVLRFEWKVKSLEDAAEIFRSLGEYKDAKVQAEFCEKKAGEELLRGYEQVYGLALSKQKNAENKSDYLDAISEYKRVLKSEQYGAEAKEHISACKKEILHIETKAVWKKRGIAFAVLCVLLFLFYRSPAYSFSRGYILEVQGKYWLAVKRYRNATAFPVTERQLRKCYLELGKLDLAKGKKKKALREFWKAGREKEAQKLAAELEKEFLKDAQVGQNLRFGTLKWKVLKNEAGHVLLISRKRGKKHLYYRKENLGFFHSYVGTWLNGKYKQARFSEYERKMLEKVDESLEFSSKKQKKYMLTLLSAEQYEMYKELLAPVKFSFWLKDVRKKGKNINCVNESGEVTEADGGKEVCYVRPVILVKTE